MESAPGVLALPAVGQRLERHDHNRRSPSWLAEVWDAAETRVLRLDAGRAPMLEGPRLDFSAPQGALPEGAVYLGAHTGRHVVAVPTPGAAQSGWADLRTLGAQLDPLEAGVLTQATAVLNWHADSAFCPRCGARTEVRSSGWMRHCPACGAEHFPRTDPAIIAAVVDDQDRLLLGSAHRWEASRYSTFAGFIESGESVEETVVREIAEEAGVRVTRVEFLGSQAWPFPRSLMLGCLAHIADPSTARADEEEIRDVRWFTREQLHAEVADAVIGIPPRSSISRALIEHWYGDTLPDLDTWTRGA